MMKQRSAVVKQLDGLAFAARADSGHWVMMDGKAEEGGSAGAATPKEMLLFALGGCTSMDVIAILKKKNAPVDGYEARMTATVREEHPQVFTTIHIEFILYGKGINPVDVERAIQLSETKYCSVTAMLRAGVAITRSFRIEEKRSGARA